ncbi:porin family protein [Aeromonas sp. MdU4]|uniref:porin family protein n=1 Tax=Aeromonas sp. MdU4 TaxID=3342819 RepID=UPI0035B6BD79
MMNIINPLTALALLCSTIAVAAPSPYIVGGTVGYGSQTFTSKGGSQGDGGDSLTGDVYYRYMFTNYIGIDSGLLFGSGGVVSAILDGTSINNVKDIRYKGVRSALYAQYPVSSGNSFYTKLGANAHKIDYTVNNVDESTSGVGFYGAAGWQYRFKSGIGINAEYQYIPMSRLDVKGGAVGVNYRF